MPEKKPPYKPSRTFDVSLRIKEMDYTNDLSSIRIISSLTAMFQVVIISLYVDPNDMILKQVYGQDSIKLSVSFIGLGGGMSDAKQIEFDLLCLKTDFPITHNVGGQFGEKNQGQNKDRAKITMITVSRIGYTVMSRNVNAVYGVVDSKKTMKLALEDLTTKVGGTLKLDQDDLYSSDIDQLIIPPSTYSNAIKYLDGIWGIFNGVTGSFCQYDGSVYIMNLTARIKKNPNIVVQYMSLDGTSEKTDKLMKDSNDGKTFYTHSKIKTQNSENTVFGVYGQTLKHIVKPKDTLSHTITQDMSDLCSRYGLISQNDQVNVNHSVDRTRYYNEHSGADYDETFAKSLISKKISDLASITFDLNNCIRFQKLLLVGSCLRIKAESMDHIPISNNYILSVSDLTLFKNPDWHVNAKLKCIRTNKSI